MPIFSQHWPGNADPVEAAYSAALDDLCVDIGDYARTALPQEVWRTTGQVFVHAGLFAEHKLLHALPAVFQHAEVAPPHPNLQERFFTAGPDALISNVIGPTRLVHNLTLLRLLGVARERVRVLAEQADFSPEYRQALQTLGADCLVKQAVFGFGGQALVAAWRDGLGEAGEVARCSGPLLRAVLVRSARGDTLVVHLTSVYGAQLIPFVDLLHREYGLEEVLLFGACGALAAGIGLHDTVFVRAVLDEDGRVLAEGNELLPLAERYPSGLTAHHRSHVADVASAICIPQETLGLLQRLAGVGASVVDLELGPLARYLNTAPGLRWGAALHVSDRPLMRRDERLGTVQLRADASEARRAEALNQAAIVSDSLTRTPLSPQREPRLCWHKVGEAGPLAVWETMLPSREGKDVTLHAALLPLDRLVLVPAVNPAGQGYDWQDEIVRGMVAWDQDHMARMNALFRRSPRQYLQEVAHEAVLGIVNGNGNLYWNLGHFVYLRPALYGHVRECQCGSQTALVQDAAGTRLAVVNVGQLGGDVEWAVSGLRILRAGEPVDLLALDPDTNRPAVHDFYGDLTHVLYGFRPSLSLSRHLFEAASRVLEHAWRSCYAKADALSPFLRDAVCGYPVTCRLAPDDDPRVVRASLARFGYAERRWGERLSPGSFALRGDQLLALAYRRATLGHSVIASTEDPSLLLLVNTYTDTDRKGFTLEDTARLVRRVAASLGHRAQEALVLSSSGDPRILLHDGRGLVCIEKDRRGEPLLFKGGLDYGLSSVLMLVARR